MFSLPATAAVSIALAETFNTRSIVILVLISFIFVVILALIAPRLKIPYPILLVLGGLMLGFIPNLPRFTLEPDLVFLLFLPPLLYSSAWFTSWRDFRSNLRPILLLAIGLVLVTTVAIAVVMHIAVPGLLWSSAFVIGAIISPTDALAATSIAQRLGVPQRIITVLEGESLVNDASGLVAYQFAVMAVVSGTFSLFEASLQFVVASIGGIALGLVSGWCLSFLHRFLDNPSLEITVTLLTPFTTYLLAETLHTSGVLATIATGLYLSWRSPHLFSSETRQQALAVWSTLVFLLNGLVFLLIGLQLRDILDTLALAASGYSPGTLIWYAALISLTTIVVRILWVFPTTYLPRLLRRRLRSRDSYPGWRSVSVIAWTGMRGVVSLAAALSLPELTAGGRAFPARPLILYFTCCVILTTLVLQGLSLSLLIRWLGLKNDGVIEQEEQKARLIASQAGIARIDELIEQGNILQEASEHLRKHYEARANSIIMERKEGKSGQQDDYLVDYRRLQLEALQAEYQSVIQLRDKNEISDEVLRRIEYEIDLVKRQLKK